MANKNENATFDAAGKSEVFFTKHRNVILGAVVAVLVVVVAWFCYTTFIGGPRAEKASTALARGQEYFNAEQFDKALNGDGAGYTGFVKIASDYGSTDAGNLANLYAGLSYYHLGQAKEAVKYLEKYSPSDDAMVSPAAVAALGNAYAAVGSRMLPPRLTARRITAPTTACRPRSSCRQVSFLRARARRMRH